MPDTTLASSTTAATATAPAQPPTPNPNGLQSLLAAAMAITGVVSALFPHAPVVGTVTNALPQLRVAVPLLLTSVGSIWAALTQPPAFRS